MDLKTFIFIGRSGCGKGTQSELLIEELKKRDPEREVLCVETGERFRELLARDTHTSKIARQIMVAGKLQPAFLAIHNWSHFFIESITGKEYLVIDGTPRKLNEARILVEALKFYERQGVAVLNIDVSREWSMARMVSRGRGDDDKLNAESRLNWFDSEVQPALEFLRDEPSIKVLDINGEQIIEDVKKEIFNKIFV